MLASSMGRYTKAFKDGRSHPGKHAFIPNCRSTSRWLPQRQSYRPATYGTSYQGDLREPTHARPSDKRDTREILKRVGRGAEFPSERPRYECRGGSKRGSQPTRRRISLERGNGGGALEQLPFRGAFLKMAERAQRKVTQAIFSKRMFRISRKRESYGSP